MSDPRSPAERTADAMEEIERAIKRQNTLLEGIADALEDRVIQEALENDLELYDDPTTNRRRQA